MPLLETRGAASAKGFGLTASTTAANYIEDVFSTWLYTGTASTQTITNGIDLSTKGGLVWTKARGSAFSHGLVDTARGTTNTLVSNLTDASDVYSTVTAFNTNGFTIGSSAIANQSGDTYASWTFRKQPKFFDVVTWTGDGTNPRQISHNLGSVPGCIIVKSTTRAENWTVYHRSLGNTGRIALNTTAAAVTGTGVWASTTPTSTTFTVSADNLVNFSGDGYVAYLFAHNAGGFGLTGTDNVISCGSYTGTGTAGNAVTLGYEPQWALIKKSSGSGDWQLVDVMRGMVNGTGGDFALVPNSSTDEVSWNGASGLTQIAPTATGFILEGGGTYWNNSGDTYIYIAIRRGPMKTPTTGTSVFSPTTAASEPQSTPLLTGGSFPSDMVLHRPRYTLTSYGFYNTSRLTGNRSVLATFNTNAEADFGANYWRFDNSTAAYIPANGYFNNNGEGNIGYALYSFRRAPGFFDVVCYTGTGVARTVNHNLGVVPELIILKSRSNGTNNWSVYSATVGNLKILRLNTSDDESSSNNDYWNSTTPTSTVFTVGSSLLVNQSSATYVSYLFASCPGVSKVGTYTGNGTSLTVNCGFTGGARFVLIKRTNSTGDWVVFDSARGIVAGNDPFLELNTTAAEQTGQDAVDADSTGFIVNQTAENLNVNGGTYIFLAIA